MKQEYISYDEIRAQKLTEYGTKVNNWIGIIINQYKDRTHFLFELLQNAEDAQASEMHFHLFRDRLVIEHNGILFSKNDIISITRIAESTKNLANSTNIGRFGIGFKSVYAYTLVPQIYSGNYSFEIKDYIYPYDIPKKTIPKGHTRIVIPFTNPEVSREKAYQEISKALKTQICSTTLLFLNNIDFLTIDIEGENERIEISKESRERVGGFGNVFDVSLLHSSINKINNRKENYSDFLLFSDGEDFESKIAFMIDDKELLPVNNTKFYTFFPTDKESHQSFFIHAPFKTTPARDNISEDHELNQLLVENICSLIENAFTWMKDHGYLSCRGLKDTYPIYEYPEDSLFYSLYETAIELIKSGERILPTNQPGVFKSYNEILIAENMTIIDNFSDDDLHQLFNNRHIFWLAKEISTNAYHNFREFLRRNLELKTYTWKDVLSRLNSRFLEQKERSWFEDLFSSIASFTVGKRSPFMGKHDIDISQIPFVRLTDGSHICALRNGKPLVYINNPETINKKIDSYFLESEIIKKYYANNVLIPVYNVERIVLDEILPKYENRSSINVSVTNLKENCEDLKLIRDALITSPTIILKIKEYYIVTDGNQWFKPQDLHVPSNFMGGQTIPEYSMIKNVCSLKYLSSSYQSFFIGSSKFFVEIGCLNTLKKTRVTQKEYLTLVKKYLGSKDSDSILIKIFKKDYQTGFDWYTLFEGFPDAFYDMSMNRSKELCRFITKIKASLSIQGQLSGANDQNFNGANVDTMKVYSAIGLLLTFKPWLYDKNGNLVAVATTRRSDLDPLYEKNYHGMLEILPFKEENQALEAILKDIEDPQAKEAIKDLLSHPDMIQDFTKSYQKMLSKLEKGNSNHKKTPEELLAEQAKKASSKKLKTKDEEDPESIKNYKRRKEKLEKEFSESMDMKIGVPSSHLKYTYHDKIAPEEKTFLEAQYHGYCQICDTGIIKFNGEPHFQAINIIKTNDLNEKYKQALSLGWNSLCLCPNCAAKFRYGTKDISTFADQVRNINIEEMQDEWIKIQIGLQGEEEYITYSPKHLLALQTALNIYSKQ